MPRTIARIINEATDDCLWHPWTRTRHALAHWRGFSRLLPPAHFGEHAIGPNDFEGLGFLKYVRDVQGWREQTRPLRGSWKIGRSASWVVPHAHVCWIAERPEVLETDARGRLHHASGAALRYRDGWSAWVWKGVVVPRWAIEHPERISPETIDATFWPSVRRCLIDIMTPERFIASEPSITCRRDETGKLWAATWRYRNIVIDTWKAVEVVDVTSQPDGTCKHYFLPVPAGMRTPREAVAWTYGLKAEQYAALELRT